jgi:hypothetical protein
MRRGGGGGNRGFGLAGWAELGCVFALLGSAGCWGEEEGTVCMCVQSRFFNVWKTWEIQKKLKKNPPFQNLTHDFPECKN